MSEKQIKKDKYVYEIWTFYTYGKIFTEEKKGICHGRFLKKKKAEQALEIMTNARGGKPDSLFSDGDKQWHFRIVKYKLNDFDYYHTYYTGDIAIFDEKEKYWYCLDSSKKRVQISAPSKEILSKIKRYCQSTNPECQFDGFDDLDMPF